MRPAIPKPPPSELLERLTPEQRAVACASYLIAVGTAHVVAETTPVWPAESEGPEWTPRRTRVSRA